MTFQDCALLIGAVAGGVATCLGAVGALWVQANRQHEQMMASVRHVEQAVINGGDPPQHLAARG